MSDGNKSIGESTSTKETNEEVIQRLSLLSEFDYEAVREAEAK